MGGFIQRVKIAQLHHPLIVPIVLSPCRAPIPALKANFFQLGGLALASKHDQILVLNRCG